MSIAATLTFSLAACGSDDNGTTADTIANVDGSGVATTVPGMRPAVPVEVAAGSSGANTAVAEREMASSDMTTSDMSMIAPYYISEFVLGEGFPALPTNDVGFVYDVTTIPTDEEIAALAAVFGVEGDVVFADQDGYKSWQVGPSDGTGPTLYVSGDAQLSWSYSPPWNDQTDSAVSCVSVDPAMSTPDAFVGTTANEPGVGDALESTTVPSIRPAEECEAPAPPANVPTADAAEAMATKTLTTLGIDTSTSTFDTYADEWNATVTATVTRDGVPTGQTYFFGYGAEGALQWSGGSLAEPSLVGPYTLVDIDTALARLVEMNAWQSMAYPTDMLAVDRAEPVVDVAAEPAVGTVDSGSGVAGSEGSAGSTEPGVAPVDPLIDPMPVDPMPVEPNPVPETYPAPEARTVTLVDVQADVWWAWDVDNVLWLLPAYRFIDTDGGWHVVPAVTDEFLIEVEQPMIEIVPPPTTTLPAFDVDSPVDPPVDPLETTTSITAPVLPVDVDVTSLEQSLGLPLDEFSKVAETLGVEVRVTERDGESLPVTMDYRSDRV
ncbi:MAG TPA: hypothetical protein VMM60_08185, partial [Ilumatobacter sp.]|nr:hypothetical protein [Ilumatobacter sp.]